jgi:hypothetical protein
MTAPPLPRGDMHSKIGREECLPAARRTDDADQSIAPGETLHDVGIQKMRPHIGEIDVSKRRSFDPVIE